MENEKLTYAEAREAQGFFGLADLLGRSLQAAAYSITHPDYEPDSIVWVGKPEAQPVEEEEPEEEPAETDGSDPVPDGYVIHSGVGSVDDQIEYAIAMFTPGLKEFMAKTALPILFHFACEQFDCEMTDQSQELSPNDKRAIALAWVIATRVFTVQHMDETVYIISATESGIRENQNIKFRPADETDIAFVVETCRLAQKSLKKDMPLQDMLAGMAEEFRRAERAERVGHLTPLSSMPNGEVLNWLFRVVSNGNRLRSNNNRHEIIETTHKGDSVRITHKNTQNGSSYSIEIAQADKLFSKTNKTFIKMFCFTLQKLAAQNFPLEVGFTLQELIDLGIYTKPSNAWRAVQDFVRDSSKIFLSGLIKKGKRIIENKSNAGTLFYNAELNNGYVTISVNEKFNMEFIASQFTEFPLFAYALNINAFLLVRYIFFLARQNTSRIKDSGTFTIKLNSVRDYLGLPAPEDVKNRRYRQLIINPIEEAIEEIETALQTVPEAKEYGFTITPYANDSGSIHQWLDEGYLEIGLKGDFAERFVDMATKAEAKRDKWNRIKTAELAKLAAKKEMQGSESAP